MERHTRNLLGEKLLLLPTLRLANRMGRQAPAPCSRTPGKPCHDQQQQAAPSAGVLAGLLGVLLGPALSQAHGLVHC